MIRRSLRGVPDARQDTVRTPGVADASSSNFRIATGDPKLDLGPMEHLDQQ